MKRRLLLSTQHPALSTLVIALVLTSGGCGARRTPDLARIFESARARKGKPPIIIVPGILGSQLRNRKTGEIVWPSAIRSDVDGLSLPMTPDLPQNRDDLVADEIVTTARLFPKLERFSPEVLVYRQLLAALKDYGGYREGSWDNPAPGDDADTFFVFPYDWRRDNVESARLLVRRIEELKRKLNKPNLRFNVVAHSMGGLVARYAAAYGASDLPPAGVAPQLTWAGAQHIAKIFMIGTPNEGSAEALVTLLEGYSITEGLRRRVHLLNKLSPEDAISAPAIFQLLPYDGAARFLDENLKERSVDLYDPATWKEYGWSPVNDADFQARYTEGRWRDEQARRTAGTLAELNEYFAAVLARARRFHDALDAAVPDAAHPVALFAFGGDCEETLSAPVIFRDATTNRWQTITQPRRFRDSAGREWKRKEVERAMYEPGDGRVTRRSLLGEGYVAPRQSELFNSPLPIAYAAFACDLHSDLQKNKTLQDNALTLLLNEVLN
ncbi:MAG: lipase/acyltransferase domain-containing protein [Pyrinomonadaceae bacterium]